MKEHADGGAPFVPSEKPMRGDDREAAKDFLESARRIRREIGKRIIGQDQVIELLLTTLFARGHGLFIGVPGLAKTLLISTLAETLRLDFSRIQSTPDLMPSDITGTDILQEDPSRSERYLRFVKGPLFCNLLLADEVNRTPPKTQAALLQVMNEWVATIDGTDHPLGDQFFVVATQNPIEHQGTYPLPEAQLDRFLFKIAIDFPSEQAELEILRRRAAEPLDMNANLARLKAVAGGRHITAGRALIDGVRLDESLLRYILELVRATRTDPEVQQGASTRAADALAGAARSVAALDGRDYAIPDDVKRLYVPALGHRIVLGPAAEIEGRTSAQVLDAILNRVEAPR